MKEVKVHNYPFDEALFNANHEALLRDPLIQSWIESSFLTVEQVKRNQNKCLAVVAEQKKCRGCLGLSVCTQSQIGHRKTIQVDEGVVDVAIEVCLFMKHHLQAQAHQRNFRINHIPKFALNMTLADLAMD